MSGLSAAKTILEADGTLLTTATGGVYDFNETGRLGINRTTTPGAFDSNEILKPCVLLRVRSARADGGLADDATKYTSIREALEIYFYEDDGYSNIETMRDRVYTLLHAVQLSGTFICYWQNDVRGARDDELDASVERSEYLVRFKRSA